MEDRSDYMPLLKRFIGSIIDKIIILILFVLVGLALSPYNFSGDLGTFIGGIFSKPPSHYSWTEMAMGSKVSLTTLDVNIAILFITINGLYYLVSEIVLKASIGKRIFGGIVINAGTGIFSIKRIFARTLVLIILVGIASYIRYPLDITYPIVIIAFFMIVDLPVLFKKRSGIDMLTHTIYVKRTDVTKKKTRLISNVPNANLEDVDIKRDGTKDVTNVSSQNKNLRKQPKLFIPFKNDDPKKNRRERILFLRFIILLCFIITMIFAHLILSYFLGDYYNILSYRVNSYSWQEAWNKSEQHSDNWKRKQIIKGYEGYQVLNREKVIALGNKLEIDSSYVPKNNVLDTFGRMISCYKGKKYSPYISGYSYHKERIPNIIAFRSGNWQDRENLYTTIDIPDPHYGTYQWNYNFLTYKIDFSSFSSKGTNQMLQDIERHLKSRGVIVSIGQKDRENVLTCYYYSNGNVIAKQILLINGKLLYLIEVPKGSKDGTVEGTDIEGRMNTVLYSLNIRNYNLIAESNIKLLWYFVGILFAVTLLVLNIMFYGEQLTKRDKVSLIVFKCVFIATFVNLLIAAIQSALLYKSYTVNNGSALVLIGTLLSVAIGGLYGINCFYWKSKILHKETFVLPTFIKKWFYSDIKSDSSKKVFITLVGYPITVLPAFPFGIYIYVYDFAVLIIVKINLWISKWLGWIDSSPSPQAKIDKAKNNNLKLLNYYAILSVKRDATIEEIEKAFTSKAADLYQKIGSSSFDKNKLEKVQEAYRVLKNPEIRNMYNKELSNMENSTAPSEYIIQNEEFINYLRNKDN